MTRLNPREFGISAAARQRRSSRIVALSFAAVSAVSMSAAMALTYTDRIGAAVLLLIGATVALIFAMLAASEI